MSGMKPVCLKYEMRKPDFIFFSSEGRRKKKLGFFLTAFIFNCSFSTSHYLMEKKFFLLKFNIGNF